MTKKKNGMGSVYQRSDGRWVAALQIGFKANGKKNVHTRYAKTEKEAKRKLRELKKAIYQAPPEQRKKQTVEQYMWAWFKRYKSSMKPAAYDRQEETIKHQVLPFLGQAQIHTVVASGIKDMMNWLQNDKGYSFSTVKKAYDACNECFQQAVADGVMPLNPCNKYNRPKEADFIDPENVNTELQFMNDEEIVRFCKEATRVHDNGKQVYRLGYAFILILNTGIRLGEALALRTEGSINLINATITVDTSMSYVKQRDNEDGCRYGFVEVLPKTKSSRRVLRLNNVALDAAQRLLELNRDHEFLLSNSKGNLITPRNFARTLKGILVKANIADFGVHVLRHTYASALFRQGVQVKAISSILGHASVQITQDTYIHLLKEQIDNAARSVNLTAAASSVTCGTMIYDSKRDRMDIRFDSGEYYDGLHRGTPLEVLLNSQWVPTRIEWAGNWFLVGLPGLSLNGLRMRIVK